MIPKSDSVNSQNSLHIHHADALQYSVMAMCSANRLKQTGLLTGILKDASTYLGTLSYLLRRNRNYWSSHTYLNVCTQFISAHEFWNFVIL